MFDRLNNEVKIGDYVRYWHKRDGRTRPDIGEIISIDNEKYVTLLYPLKSGQKHICVRIKSGITHMSKESIMLEILEKDYND